MHQLFRGLHAKLDDSHQQKNHGVEFVSGILLKALQSCFLDNFDLSIDEAEVFDVTPKRCSRVGWQRDSLGRSHLSDLLSNKCRASQKTVQTVWTVRLNISLPGRTWRDWCGLKGWIFRNPERQCCTAMARHVSSLDCSHGLRAEPW